MGALAVGKITLEEYFAMDEVSERPLEYYDGEVFPMVTATVQHAIISVNASRRLAERLDGSPCIATGNLRVRTTASNYVIPDITVVCGGFIQAGAWKDANTNPKVIVEILSPTTADFDHGGKFALYCQLPSFTEYVLIAQDEPKIEVFYKVSDMKWMLTKYDGMQSIVKIESLGIEIPASEIYQGVAFPASS